MQKNLHKIFILANAFCFISIYNAHAFDLQSTAIIRVAQPLINSAIRDASKLPGIASDIVYLQKDWLN